MVTTSAPGGERARLAALAQSALLYSPAEERFDRITRLASHVLGTPIALVSLIAETQQWFKSSHGLEVSETPREVAFCAHAIAAGERLVVEDATADARFAANPLVTGEPHIRAYAGSVIRAPSGEPLGTLCVIDSRPRQFSAAEIALLADLAAIAQAEVAQVPAGLQSEYLRRLTAEERQPRIDAATRSWSHDAMAELLMEKERLAAAGGAGFALALVRIGRLGRLSEGFGDEVKGAALREAAAMLKRSLGESDALGRYDDETFIALLADVADEPGALAAAGRLRDTLASRPVKAGALSLWLKAAVAVAPWKRGASLVDMIESASEAVSGDGMKPS